MKDELMNNAMQGSGETARVAMQEYSVRQPVRYGLPCVECKAYYVADLCVCPICGCAERVPATTALMDAPTLL